MTPESTRIIKLERAGRSAVARLGELLKHPLVLHDKKLFHQIRLTRARLAQKVDP